jgi:hypothetical protein
LQVLSQRSTTAAGHSHSTLHGVVFAIFDPACSTPLKKALHCVGTAWCFAFGETIKP